MVYQWLLLLPLRAFTVILITDKNEESNASDIMHLNQFYTFVLQNRSVSYAELVINLSLMTKV